MKWIALAIMSFFAGYAFGECFIDVNGVVEKWPWVGATLGAVATASAVMRPVSNLLIKFAILLPPQWKMAARVLWGAGEVAALFCVGTPAMKAAALRGEILPPGVVEAKIIPIKPEPPKAS